MTDSFDVATDDLTYRQAFQRAWVAAPTATIRNVAAVGGALFFLGVHVALYLVTGAAWSLLAVPVLPLAAWLLLHGWVRQRLVERAIGLGLFVVGAMVPFYLA